MNILVTAIGAYAADIVIKTLKANNHRVIGCDILPREWIADAYNVDHFIQAPRVTDRGSYKEFITGACSEFALDCIMPLTDPEVDIICEMKGELAELGVCACVSELEVTRLCRDKYLLTRFVAREKVCDVIPAYLLGEADGKNIDFPLLAKPRYGRSSQGLIIVNSQAAMEYVRELAKDTDYIIQPYVEGSVITVDAVRSNDSTVVCLARRELLRSLSGAGTTVEIIESPELNDICRQITNRLGIIGTVNFEFIDKMDKLYFMEANPRFSGGVEFSHMAGYDVVTNHLRCFTGGKIETDFKLKKMIIARKYEEYVTKGDG